MKEENGDLAKRLSETEEELVELRESRDEFKEERAETEHELLALQEAANRCQRDNEAMLLEVLIFIPWSQGNNISSL